LKVLLASRSAPAVDALQAALADRREFLVERRVMTNGHTDPLHGGVTPDVLVFRFDDQHLGELATLAEMNPSLRPPVILVGPLGQADAMRLAVRTGARDFLAEPVDPAELVAALGRIRDEGRAAAPAGTGTVSAFVGVAGGVGTSLIACNVADLLVRDGHSTCLVDLDRRYGALGQLLDLSPKLGLTRALQSAEALDGHAIGGFVATHGSGLRLLSTASDEAFDDGARPEQLPTLLAALASLHEHVIVDVPQALDPFGATACALAQNVVVVLQQSVIHVRNAVRLRGLLTRDLGVPESRLTFVLNRAARNAPVTIEDVAEALGTEPLQVPNHYRSARESVDTGVLLYDVDRDGPVVRALGGIRSRIAGDAPVAKPAGLLRRALPSFLRSRT
jgi:pilus assembly protein CpaE